jgi:Protein of unknown function (DUF3489)
VAGAIINSHEAANRRFSRQKVRNFAGFPVFFCSTSAVKQALLLVPLAKVVLTCLRPSAPRNPCVPGLSAVTALLPSLSKEDQMKFSSAQLAMLAAAARRDDRGIKRPSDLDMADTEKVVSRLAGAGLIEEVTATGRMPVWRVVEGQRFALRLTDNGLKTTGIAREVDSSAGRQNHAQAETAAAHHALAPRRTGSRRATASRIRAARGKTSKARSAKATTSSIPKGRAGHRAGTKMDEITRLLSRKRGATIEDIMTATGWQAHSVRGAMSGTIKKKLKLKLVSEKQGNERRYRISGSRGA